MITDDDPLERLKKLKAQAPAPDPLEQLKATKQPTPEQPGRVASGLSGLAQGATLGFADEALGAIEGANQWMHGGSFSKGYQEGRDKTRGVDKAAAHAHGGYHLGGEIVGGAIPFVTGGGIGAGFGRAAAQGAAIGGVAGFGKAQGDATAQAEGAGAGALAGAVAGPLLHGAGMLGGKVVDAIGRSRVANALPSQLSPFLNANEQARRVLLERLQAGGKSIQDVTAESQLPVHQGQPTTLADLGGDELTRVARGVQTKPKTSAAIRDPYTARQGGQLDRITAEGSQQLGIDPENVRQTARDLRKEAQTASAPFYAKALSTGPVDDPRMNELLQLPFFRDAFAQGKKLSALDERPVPRITETSHTMVPFELDGVPLLGPDGTPKLMVPSGETTTTRDIPTAQSLHYTKLALGDQIERGARGQATEPGGLGSNQLPVLKGKHDEFLAAFDNAVPAYGEARAAFAGPAGKRGSLLAGQKAMQSRMRPEDITDILAQAKDKSYFQRGAWNELLQKAGNVPDANGESPRDVSKVFNGSPNIRGSVAATFGDKPQFPGLLDALSRESRYSKTASDILGGSPTANKLEDVAGISGGPHISPRTIGSMAHGNVGGLLHGLFSAAKSGQHEYADQVAQELAPMLTAGIQKPSDLSALLDELAKFAPTLQRRQMQGGATRKALAGQIGGTVGGFIAP